MKVCILFEDVTRLVQRAFIEWPTDQLHPDWQVVTEASRQ